MNGQNGGFRSLQRRSGHAPPSGSRHAPGCRVALPAEPSIAESYARVAPPGEIRVGKDTSLVPDILVYPARFALGTAWKDVTGWLLASGFDRSDAGRLAPGDAAPRIERERVVCRTPGGEHQVAVHLDALFLGAP